LIPAPWRRCSFGATTADKETGTIVLENYNISPVMLNKVRREEY